MSKEPKRCSYCDGKGLHTWTERNGTARGLKCEGCNGTGKIPTPLAEPPIPQSHD